VCVAVCCGVLRCVAVCCRGCLKSVRFGSNGALQVMFFCVCCGVSRCVAVCCSMLQGLSRKCAIRLEWCSAGVFFVCVLRYVAVCRDVLRCVAGCLESVRFGSNGALKVNFRCVLRCVAVCCDVLQCVAVCCSVLHRVWKVCDSALMVLFK